MPKTHSRQPTRDPNLGAVYFVQEGGAGAIKIGYTGDLVAGGKIENVIETRIRQHSTSNAHRLTLVHYIYPANKNMEAAYHALLEPWRTDGQGREWFHREAAEALIECLKTPTLTELDLTLWSQSQEVGSPVLRALADYQAISDRLTENEADRVNDSIHSRWVQFLFELLLAVAVPFAEARSARIPLEGWLRLQGSRMDGVGDFLRARSRGEEPDIPIMSIPDIIEWAGGPSPRAVAVGRAAVECFVDIKDVAQMYPGDDPPWSRPRGGFDRLI